MIENIREYFISKFKLLFRETWDNRRLRTKQYTLLRRAKFMTKHPIVTIEYFGMDVEFDYSSYDYIFIKNRDIRAYTESTLNPERRIVKSDENNGLMSYVTPEEFLDTYDSECSYCKYD